MTAHALPQQIAQYTETAFVTGGPASWSANGDFVYVTKIDTSGLVQAVIENTNNRLRPLDVHQPIRGLRNGSLSLGYYFHANPTHAAEAAAATTFHLADTLFAALGGRDLGWGIGAASSGDEETNECEVDADPGFEQGDWVYIVLGGVGEFYRIASIAAGPPVTLVLDRDLHDTVDSGGGDRVYAVIDCFIHQAAITQHDHANHKTMQFLAQGDASDDVVIAKGCKPTVTFEPITAGAPLQISVEAMATTFAREDASKVTFSTTPLGSAGLVTGVGTSTKIKFATFGSPLAAIKPRGAVTVSPGVAYDIVPGPAGDEGVNGHVATLAPATLEIIVPWSASHNTDFRAGTTKHALVQVGDTANAVGFYFPRVTYASEPLRSDEGGLASSTLSLTAMENNASAGSLTGDSLEKWRSPFHVLIVA